MSKPRGLAILALLACLWLGPTAPAQTPPAPHLADVVAALTAPLVGDVDGFACVITAGDAAAPRLRLALRSSDPQGFVLEAQSEWATFTLARDAGHTLLLLPQHGVAFVGEGEVGPAQSLAPRGLLARLSPAAGTAAGIARAALLSRLRASGADAAFALAPRITLQPWLQGAGVSVVSAGPRGFFADLRRFDVSFDDDAAAVQLPSTAGLQVHLVARAELETMVFAAARRLVEIYVPGLQPPERLRPRQVDGGELRIESGQRVVLLAGSPERIGRAHGELLGPEVRRTVDSCLYLIGLGETVRTGKWFPAELAEAWRRLGPHIPARLLRELEALAHAVPDLSVRELQLASVFPEYFHCSGFAVFGKATVDGVLYHGRVLDYMTMIGLQQAAATFVVQPERGYGFVNVGFAGFIGSVTGMNERQVSLGEMGGRGEGKWDGVPMAVLMRQALEECGTLAEVQELWRRSPRTCEYYYVFADGKDRSAVGVAATADAVEFVAPGATHPQLMPGIADTVILSAGSRLDLLHQRIQQGYGKIDQAAALHLMDRPVAMASNLHDALMVPEQGLVYVAVASATEPAAAMPYARIDFGALLAGLQADKGPRRYFARDTLPALVEPRADARAMLQQLWYEPAAFEVEVTRRAVGDASSDCTAKVHFPSVRSGPPWDDHPVVLEWYPACGKRVARNAPAVLVLHILDGRMLLERAIARGLSRHGIHAFVIHLPGYGERANGARRPQDPRQWLTLGEQAVVDARRARDAIAALPGIDPRHISIQGTSLGGFFGAVAAALDGAFEQAFLFLAGGDLRTMFENGEQDVARLRAQMHRAGMADAEIGAMLDAVDPARVAHRLDPARTWLYSGRFDRVVPAANAAALGAAAGLDAEHHQWFDVTHYTGVVLLPDLLRQMVEHIGARAR